MSSPDFTSTDAKLSRAEEHLHVLGGEVLAWLQSGSYTYTVDVNEDRTQVYFRAKLYGVEPNFLRWTLIVGDLINNLRSSLDHVVYAIAKHESVNNPAVDTENLAFLITDSPLKWNDRNNRRRVAGLSASVVDAIERFQSYNRPHPLLPPLLQILRNFSNDDKHRLLKIAASAVQGASIEFADNNLRKIAISSNPVEDGEIFAIVETGQPEPDLAVNAAQFTVEVALWHGLKDGQTHALQARTSIIPLLELLLGEVKLVIAELKAAVV